MTVLGIVGLTLVACGSSQAQPDRHLPVVGGSVPTTPSHPTSESLGLIPANPALTDRLVLGATRVPSGTTIKGTLLVTNHSDQPINLSARCQPSWAVGLVGQTVTQHPAFTTSCTFRPLLVHPGVNRYAVSFQTTYSECATTQTRSVIPIPACRGNGAPGLPSGTYFAYLFGLDLALPEPSPVAVTVTVSPMSVNPSVCMCPAVPATASTVVGPPPCRCPTSDPSGTTGGP